MKKYIVLFIALITLSPIAKADGELVGYLAERDETLQEKAVSPDANYLFQKGDTIVIKKSEKYYLTGEVMSEWVYYVRHVILQVGGKRFPNGVLINGIYSWVDPQGLYLAGSTNLNKVAEDKKAEDKPGIDERQKEFENMPEEDRQRILEDAANHPGNIPFEEEKPVEEQPVEKPVEETPVEQPVEEAPVEEAPVEEAPAEQPAQQPVEEQPATQPVVEETPLPTAKPVVVQGNEEAVYNVSGNQLRTEIDRFTIGLRGGCASLMHKANEQRYNLNWNAGFDVLLDLQYAHYWRKTDDKPFLGLLVGVAAGYSRSPLAGAVNDDPYVVSTSEGDLTYKITADKVAEYDGQIQLEVPIMFSMIHKGFFLNAGPRMSFPVFAHYNQEITNGHITATFPEGVVVPDELITGKLTENQKNTVGNWQHSTLNVMLSAELGYEWNFKNNHSLGLGAYANYSVYTLYKNNTSTGSLVAVTDVPGAGSPAVVDVKSATNTYANGMGYFDVGIKLAYHFNWFKYK